MSAVRLLYGVVLAVVGSVASGADLAVDVTDCAAVNIDVGGVRCLDSFQVILPAPGQPRPCPRPVYRLQRAR